MITILLDYYATTQLSNLAHIRLLWSRTRNYLFVAQNMEFCPKSASLEGHKKRMPGSDT